MKQERPANRPASFLLPVMIRWLPALGVAVIALVLGPRLLDYAQHSWEVLNFPWQLDFDEGVNLNASRLLSQGVNIYSPNPPDHFVSSMYPPLYFALNAAAIKLWGLGLTSGRLIAFAGALAVGATLWAWVYFETRRHAAGLLAALLWFSLGPVYVWSTFYKQDMLALALGLVGCVLATRSSRATLGDKSRSPIPDPRPLYLAIIPLALAFWTKQSSLAPVAAVGLFVMLRDWRLGLRWGLVAVGAIVIPFIVLDLLLNGGLHTHVFAFDYYGRSEARVAKNMDALWNAHAPLILCAVGFAVLALVQSPKSKVQSPRASILDSVPLSVLYLLVSIPPVLLSNSLPTANYNHLLDILAPLCLVTGVAFSAGMNTRHRISTAESSSNLRTRRSLVTGHWSLTYAVLLLALVQTVLVYDRPGRAWYTPLGIPLVERAERMERLSEAVRNAPGDVLSEDNWLLIKSGKRVLYDDPAAMAALANAGVWDQSVLLQDINRRKFSLVLLQYDLTNETYNPRWTNQALQALKANYSILFRDVLFAHAPRPPSSEPETTAGCTIQGGPWLEGYTFWATNANHGDNLPVSLYWRKINGLDSANIKFFVRLVDPAGVPKWGADLPPGEAAGKPMSSWANGETVRDDLSIPVAPGLPFGRYRLVFGTYIAEGGNIKPLPMNCSGNLAAQPDGSRTLAEIEVVERWDK